MDSFNDVYSVRPYKKKWYDIVGSTKLSESTQLTLIDLLHDNDRELLKMRIRGILTIGHIYQLEICQKKIDVSALTDIIHASPKIQSLKVRSLSLSEPIELFSDEKILLLASKEHEITKVCLEKMIKMEEVYYLMKLCPRMKFLQVDCINTIEIELFVRDILKQINKTGNQYLRSLCIRVPTADVKMLEKLEEMINSKKLLDHYTSERVLDHIYLQWGDD